MTISQLCFYKTVLNVTKMKEPPYLRLNLEKGAERRQRAEDLLGVPAHLVVLEKELSSH